MLEHEFILNYARINPVPIDFPLDLDWQYILKQARYHNIAPLLHNNIKNLPISKELERIYTYTAYHNMLYLEELQRISERIKVIVLKGPILAQDIYRNIGLRPFRDLDILIKKTDLPKIKEILYSMGYATSNEKFYKDYHFLLPFTKQSRIPLRLELHWSFIDRFIINRIEMEKIWGTIEDNRLPDEINILYLLLHIEKHAFFNKAIYKKGDPRDWIFTNPRGNQLIWYIDLHEIISSRKMDWQRLLETAKEWCIQNIVYYNLYILNKLYPAHPLEELPSPDIGLAKRIFYNIALIRNPGFETHPSVDIRPIKIVELINYFFPSPDIIKKYYCKKQHIPVIIYYLVHLIIGLKEILILFQGICRGILSTDKKMESQSAG